MNNHRAGRFRRPRIQQSVISLVTSLTVCDSDTLEGFGSFRKKEHVPVIQVPVLRWQLLPLLLKAHGHKDARTEEENYRLQACRVKEVSEALGSLGLATGSEF